MIQVPALSCGCRPGSFCDEQRANLRQKGISYSDMIHLEAELDRRDLKQYGRMQLEQRLERAREKYRGAVQAIKRHRLENIPETGRPPRGRTPGAQEGTEAEHRPSCPAEGKVTT